MPTAGFLADASESLSFDALIIQPMTSQPPVVTDLDIETCGHHEVGLSTYDHFEDGPGVCFSSYLRPIVNMRPKHRMSSIGVRNSAARVLENVVNAFLTPGRLPGQDWTVEEKRWR